jgi:hypothetical protein
MVHKTEEQMNREYAEMQRMALEYVRNAHNDIWREAMRYAQNRLADMDGPSAGPEFGPEVDESQILAGATMLEPGFENGAVVSISALRAMMHTPEGFDQSLLNLARADRIALHQHDWPSSLSEAERSALLCAHGCDRRAAYYVGFAKRM